MENKILILDIETTGFINQGGSIVEIGAVELDIVTGEIKEVFNSLVREGRLNKDHTKEPLGWIFKNSDLKFSDLFYADGEHIVYPKFQELLNIYTNGCTAYNQKFDFEYLEDRGLKIDKKLPCPMLLSTDICKMKNPYGYSNYKWPKVEEAYAFFFPDKEYVEAHRGADDARHEAEIVYELIKRGVFKIEE